MPTIAVEEVLIDLSSGDYEAVFSPIRKLLDERKPTVVVKVTFTPQNSYLTVDRLRAAGYAIPPSVDDDVAVSYIEIAGSTCTLYPVNPVLSITSLRSGLQWKFIRMVN